MHLIPWDLDNAFEVIKNEGNPVIPIKIAGERKLMTANPSSMEVGVWPNYQQRATKLLEHGQVLKANINE